MTLLLLIAFLLLPVFGRAQNTPKVRMAYTSINIQMTPIYPMKELDLARKQGLDAEVPMIPVNSPVIQAALAGEIQFILSGDMANITANMSDGNFVGITSTISTFGRGRRFKPSLIISPKLARKLRTEA